jgi:hypothetical protein
MSAFQGGSAHHNSAASYWPGVGELLRQVPRLFGLGAKNTFYTHFSMPSGAHASCGTSFRERLIEVSRRSSKSALLL